MAHVQWQGLARGDRGIASWWQMTLAARPRPRPRQAGRAALFDGLIRRAGTERS